MIKLTIFAVLIAVSAAALVSSQRAIIHHRTPHGYGDGISSRYFDKAEQGYGLGARYLLGGIYDGRHHGGIYDGRHRGDIYDGRRHEGIYDGRRHGGIYDGRHHGGIYDGRHHGGIYDGRHHGNVYNLGYRGRGVAVDGIDNLGVAYNNLDLADGRLVRLGRVGRGYGLGGLGFLY